MSTIWKTMIGISGAGLITLVYLGEVPMNAHTDESYGLHVDVTQEKRARDEETTIAEVSENTPEMAE